MPPRGASKIEAIMPTATDGPAPISSVELEMPILRGTSAASPTENTSNTVLRPPKKSQFPCG